MYVCTRLIFARRSWRQCVLDVDNMCVNVPFPTFRVPKVSGKTCRGNRTVATDKAGKLKGARGEEAIDLIKRQNESFGRKRWKKGKEGLIATSGDRIKIATIDGWVSQIRNLLTMVRKAIHLDGREKRTSIDLSRTVTAWRATATKLSRASHVVSGPRLLKERERKREIGPQAIRAAIAFVMARLFTLLPNW